MRTRLAVLISLILVVPVMAAISGGAPADARVKPRLTLSTYPVPIAQSPAGRDNLTLYWGKVRPARKGARVFLERRTKKGRWVVVSKTRQNRHGNYRGRYAAWPKSREVLRVRSKPGRAKRLYSSRIKHRRTWPRKFNENFWGTRLNTKRWATRKQPMTGSRPCARPAANRVKVGNGIATLSVRKVARWCAASPKHKGKGKYHNAMIGTRKPFRYKHGVFAARIRFQRVEGMHGAFWLQGPARTGAEIDVAEYFGSTSPSNLSILVHHTNRHGKTRTYGKRGSHLPTRRILGKRKNPHNSFHVYAVHWNKNRYQFWLDGKLMMTTSRPKMLTKREEIVLSLLTSEWEIGRLKSTRPVMQVDWVRVWQP